VTVPTYLSELNAALGRLDDFDSQLADKINGGKIVEPDATYLSDASAEIRSTIQILINNA